MEAVQRRSQKSFLLLLLVLTACVPALAQDTAATAPAATSKSKPKAKTKSKKPASATNRKRKTASPRVRRLHQAFIASAALKPMGRQLLQDRTPAAYSGVEAFARAHTKEDAGALAWLALGYAHTLDHDFARAIDPLARAKPKAGDLGDYIDYYLGQSYFQTGRSAEAIVLFSQFDNNYPDSLLLRDAHVIYANALLAQARPAEAVVVLEKDLLEKDRAPIRADVELALGRAYVAAGDPAKAAPILRNLYFNLPLAYESAPAGIELNKLTAAQPQLEAGLQEHKTRAALLLKAKRYSDAAEEYRTLLGEVSVNDRPAMQIALAECLRRGGQAKDAKKLLDSIPNPTPELNAERLFNLAEIARALDKDDDFLRLLDELRQSAPTSPWLEQALFSAGNIFLLRRDFDRAIDSFREMQQRFPDAQRASSAHWKAAWLTLRQGRNAQAKTSFEEHIALYPNSGEVPAALYWRARLAEEDNDWPMARAYYQKLSARFRNYYYAELARQRLILIKIQAVNPPPHFALLDRVPPLDSGAKVITDEPPADDLRVQKARLLENGGLIDLAIREYKAAAEETKANWLPSETARMYQDAGRYDIALEVLKRAVPNYFAVDLPSLPRPYWEALFPRPYWADLKRYAEANALDPYLVASLIRQESEFNPNAVSRANALGLMQLLPKVGKGVAKQEKIKHFNTTQLFTPAVNLRLGTRYFRSEVDRFGAFEYALAAYNAGENRVVDWQGQAKYRDTAEFVESIPFTETREYVQAILRNASVYRQLYGAP